MQASYTSVNTAEIKMRDAVRHDLQSKTAEFLKSNAITVVGDRASAPDRALAFNRIIATAPSKQSTVAKDKENIESLVKKFAFIEIEGVTLIRSAYEVAKLIRDKGYKLRSQSVIRVARDIGIQLAG